MELNINFFRNTPALERPYQGFLRRGSLFYRSWRIGKEVNCSISKKPQGCPPKRGCFPFFSTLRQARTGQEQFQVGSGHRQVEETKLVGIESRCHSEPGAGFFVEERVAALRLREKPF